MSSKLRGPVFHKSQTTSRRVTEYQNKTDSTKAKSALNTADSADDRQLRLIQYEIAEREACKIIATMSHEAAVRLKIEETEYKIDDILTGVLVLSNLYKRVGGEKDRIEEDMNKLCTDHADELAAKNLMIERLEQAVLRQQEEQANLQGNISELKLNHSHRMMKATKEIHEHKENYEKAQNELADLQLKLKEQERKLMQVPRMEEHYQRTARGMIRQQEVANTLKEIEWKKKEDDVKSLVFWKTKAKSLEETVMKQQAEIEQLDKDGRLALSRYQNLLSNYNSLKRLHPHHDDGPHHLANPFSGSRPTSSSGVRKAGGGGGGRVIDVDAGTGARRSSLEFHAAVEGMGRNNNTTTGNKSKSRPISAPAGRRSAQARGDSEGAEGYPEAGIATEGGEDGPSQQRQRGSRPSTAPKFRQSFVNSTKRNSTASSAGTSRFMQPTSSSSGGDTLANTGESGAPRKRNVFKRSLNEINNDELTRLREQIAVKDAKIAALFRKLSYARAYPLKGIQDVDDGDTGLLGTGEDTEDGKKEGAGASGRLTRGASLRELLAVESDDEPDTASFVAEEAEHVAKRNERAMDIQRMFNERSASRKASNPPHIRAIREAKSFSQSGNPSPSTNRTNARRISSTGRSSSVAEPSSIRPHTMSAAVMSGGSSGFVSFNLTG